MNPREVMRATARAVVVATAVAAASAPATAPAAAPAADEQTRALRATGSVDIGYDSFQERYSIVDADTVDRVDEVRARAAVGLLAGSRLGDFVHMEGRSLVGAGDYEVAGRLSLARSLSATRTSRFALDGDWTHRGFRDNSVYEFANDLTRISARSSLRWGLSDALSIRFSGRFERVDYRDRTEFDYDYRRNGLGIQTTIERGLAGFVTLGLRFVTMAVPDSSQIEYHAWMPEFELEVLTSPRERIGLHATAERRGYADDTVRSSFWALLVDGNVRAPVGGAASVEIDDRSEVYGYDHDSDVYFDYLETHNAILVNYHAGWTTTLGAGPTAGLFVSDASPDDEYHEFGGKVRLDHSRDASLWVSASWEVGRRLYSAFKTDGDAAVFSDYTYQRVQAFATVRVWEGVSLNLLLDWEPEDHARVGDDATTTLFSASATWVY